MLQYAQAFTIPIQPETTAITQNSIKKGKGAPEPLVNEAITGDVRLVKSDGTSVMTDAADALAIARSAGLDLVEVSAGIVKIFDYSKHKYDEAKKAKEARAKQRAAHRELKEVQFRPAVAEHDYNVKLGRVAKFAGDGHKVKIVVKFRGRELASPEVGYELARKVAADAGAAYESGPKFSGRQIVGVLSPTSSMSAAGDN